MAANFPRTMHALALSKYCKPNEYEVATLPTPEISNPDEILIKVHAASVNPGMHFQCINSFRASSNSMSTVDVKMASGVGKLMGKDSYVPFPSTSARHMLTSSHRFPYKIGYDLSGTVIAIGAAVTSLKPGDEVFSRIPRTLRGSIAEYALSTSSTTALKPKTVSFGEAASIPLAAQTALQALYRGESEFDGGLKGKTVFIPGGLSGTGSFAIQLAKNVFSAGKVVTTVSTGKLGRVEELLGEGAPDLTVDYTREDVVGKVGRGSVDFMFDTVGQTIKSLPMMKRGGRIVSISTLPSGKLMKQFEPSMPLWLGFMLDLVNWFFEVWTGWKGVGYEYLFLKGNTSDLEKLAKWVDEGKVRPVVGERVKLSDVEGVRRGCQQIYDGKGGVGKFVIDID